MKKYPQWPKDALIRMASNIHTSLSERPAHKHEINVYVWWGDTICSKIMRSLLSRWYHLYKT